MMCSNKHLVDIEYEGAGEDAKLGKVDDGGVEVNESMKAPQIKDHI